MNILLSGIGLFLVAFAGHWIIWRIRRPAHAVISLLLIDALVLFAGLSVLGQTQILPDIASHGLWPYLQIALLYVALCFSYVINYSGLEEDSPSFAMVKFVELAKEKGRGREEFNRIITDELIVYSRLRALMTSGLITFEGDRYSVTAKGLFWNRMFGFWRSLLGIHEGG